MNKDELKGKLQNIKGRVKEAAAALTGDKGKQAEGMADRAVGAGREKLGQAKEAIDKTVDEVKEEVAEGKPGERRYDSDED